MNEMSLGSLFYELGFKADTTKFNDFIGMVGRLNMSSILGTGALGGLYSKAEEILNKVAPIAVEMQTFANVTGLSAQQMKAWDNSAKQFGTAAGATTSAVKGLQSSLASLWSTSPDSNFLQAVGFLNNVGAGISNEDFAPDRIWILFDKIGEAITKMEPAQARMVLGMLRMDESLMNAFRNMKKFREERESASVADQGSLKALTDYWDRATRSGNEMLTLTIKIGAGIASIVIPVIELVGGLSKAINGSKELQAAILGVATALALAFGPVWTGLAMLGASAAWINANKEKLGEMSAAGSRFIQTPAIGTPMGISMGLPPGMIQPVQVTVSSTNYITGNDTAAMKKALEDQQRENIESIKSSMGRAGL